MIDWSRVSELREEIGAEDFDEVVEIFLEEVEGVLDKLRANDRSALEQDLHFLKGSALNLGFRKFSMQCMEGERAAAQGMGDSVDLPSIVTMYEQSKLTFLQELPNR
ncbi:Hpt domain-containing protein [Epibacterium sp. SM1979]|uniref:Hpt domain-containing protein n=1 Tax=Tritonibacter litoralis TaxID=2662264 RepID=A0A843YB75_9RHOB|nr:Hpt domain-containing protein [Tritonibacter litoralis]MQQ08231.1 Hpt domain-containing protein [Tritonibacter litoralis]